MLAKVAIKALMAMGTKLLTAAFMEDIIIWGLEQLVKNTGSKVDDQLLAKVKEHLNGA